MKTVFIVVATAMLSSAGTFFYTTQEMAPSFYHGVIAKVSPWVEQIRNPASRDCSVDRDRFDQGEGNGGAPQMGEMLRQIRQSQKEKDEALKDLQRSDRH